MKSKLEKLEMLRGFAAAYVFAGHFIGDKVLAELPGAGHLFRFGQEAVVLFFLISGFVVHYSTEKQGDLSFGRYLVRRARRIFPIYLLALGLALLVAWFSANRNPADFTAGRILGNVFMLQDFQEGKPGVWVSTLAGNLPLWSLSYEWWFYLLFYPVRRFVPEGARLHVAGAISLTGFATYWLCPNQASLFAMYFLVWWTGAELARSYLAGRGPSWRTERRSLVYLGTLAALACGAAAFGWWRGEATRFGLHPVLEARHLLAGFVFLCGGLAWARLRWIGFRWIFGGFAAVAPISYALYVLHMPLAVKGEYLEWVEPAWLRLTGYVLAALVVAWLAEGPFQRWINRATARWAEKRGPARTG